MTKSLLALILILVLPSPGRATELIELGEGLSYLRIHAVDDSAKGLTAAIRERNFLVLDLRHASGTPESADLLRAALNARESKQPVFILVSPATPRVLAESLMTVANKCLMLGVKESAPSPQVFVDQPLATDSLAYEALESGQTLASLISSKVVKERFDEVALMKEFASGNTNAAPSPLIDPTAKPGAPEKPQSAIPKPPESLTDRVLQRAIHLHRALLAIKQR